jgi:hypothetical protein
MFVGMAGMMVHTNSLIKNMKNKITSFEVIRNPIPKKKANQKICQEKVMQTSQTGLTDPHGLDANR